MTSEINGSDDNEDFMPFLSSTENEFTDLNTDFNTDGPQSTYRVHRSKLSNHKEKIGQVGGQGNSSSGSGNKPNSNRQNPPIIFEIEESKIEPTSYANDPMQQQQLMITELQNKLKQDQSFNNQEDMSFDNESVQRNSGNQGSDIELNNPQPEEQKKEERKSCGSDGSFDNAENNEPLPEKQDYHSENENMEQLENHSDSF